MRFFSNKKKKIEHVDIDTTSDIDNEKDYELDEESRYANYLEKLSNAERLDDDEWEDYSDISLKKVIEEHEKSYNPKYHRTEHERELRSLFSRKYRDTIDIFESKIYIADLKNLKSLQANLKAFYEFKEFCYSDGEGGRIYFQDMWEYCHNSKNPCFSFSDRIHKAIEDLNKTQIIILKILNILGNNEEILQKDIYDCIPEYSKSEISYVIYSLDKMGKIFRSKYKNTYILTLNKSEL